MNAQDLLPGYLTCTLELADEASAGIGTMTTIDDVITAENSDRTVVNTDLQESRRNALGIPSTSGDCTQIRSWCQVNK